MTKRKILDIATVFLPSFPILPKKFSLQLGFYALFFAALSVVAGLDAVAAGSFVSGSATYLTASAGTDQPLLLSCGARSSKWQERMVKRR